LAIRSADPGRFHAESSELRDKLLVHHTAENSNDDFQRGVISDAQSAVRPLRYAEAAEVRVNVLAAAMNENELLAVLPCLRHSAQHFRAPRSVIEKASAQLDHPHARPSVSGNPHMRLKFCTACDAAPLSRLSITETITARRPPCSSVKPISARGVLTTLFSSGSCPAGNTRTSGALAYALVYASASCWSVMACRNPTRMVD